MLESKIHGQDDTMRWICILLLSTMLYNTQLESFYRCGQCSCRMGVAYCGSKDFTNIPDLGHDTAHIYRLSLTRNLIREITREDLLDKLTPPIRIDTRRQLTNACVNIPDPLPHGFWVSALLFIYLFIYLFI